MVFQNYSLLPWLSVLENVQLAVDQVFPEQSRDERRARAMKFVEMVNLGPAAGKLPRELSGGMRQRVVGRARLVHRAGGACCSTSRSARSTRSRARVLQGELQRISQESGKTMLLITNDVDEGILLVRSHHSARRRTARVARTGHHRRHRTPARSQRAEPRPALPRDSSAACSSTCSSRASSGAPSATRPKPLPPRARRRPRRPMSLSASSR